MQATKITQPLWVGNHLGPKIDSYVKKLNMPGITYESMCIYFTNTVQFGMDNSEFWVVFEEGKPMAFGQWNIMPLPYIGSTYFGNIYSWTKNQEPVDLLIEELIKFGVKHRTVIFYCDVLDEIVGRRLEIACNKLKYACSKSDARRYTVIKQVEKKNESNNTVSH
jgi:hypothetical protein